MSSPSSIALNTFAVMGINALLLQANVMSRAKLDSMLPAKITAGLNIKEGHFKMEALPVSVPEYIANLQ